jgi:ATP-dependent Clp protease protease subunit
MKKRLNKIISDGTGQPMERVTNDSDRNFWLGAEEAIEYGIVNKIITSIKEIK